MPKHLLFICTGNYYRSRFAEAVFNHHAECQALEWRAFSRGLATHLAPEFPLLSEHTTEGLALRGIDPRHTARGRVQLSEPDLMSADLIVALKAAEHRPMFEKQFPAWVERVTFWNVSDLDQATPDDALAAIEKQVLALIESLEN
jgi:protein-tyrosine phosphatase